MQILVTGATGFIGSRLCHRLSLAGHTLVGLSRDAAAAKQRMPTLSRVYTCDPLVALTERRALEGIDAVIHLAGESLSGRWTARKKSEIRQSRILGTRHLVEAIASVKSRPKVMISTSAIGYYGDRGEEELREEALPGTGFVPQLCRDWEAEALRAEHYGVRVAVLRMGLVLGATGGALGAMLPLFKVGLGGPLGSGRQWWSWVHLDDVVGLIEHLLHNDLSGIHNVAAPQPMRQGEFAQVLGKVLRRPAFVPAPGFALKLALGEFSRELLSSRKVLAQRAHQSGYRFKFPQLEAALRDLLQHS